MPYMFCLWKAELRPSSSLPLIPPYHGIKCLWSFMHFTTVITISLWQPPLDAPSDGTHWTREFQIMSGEPDPTQQSFPDNLQQHD